MLPILSKPNLRITTTNKSTLEALSRLQKIILNTLDFNEVVKFSVNSVLTELGYLDLGYRIIVLALVNEDKGVLQRVAISQTKEAEKALEVTPIPFREIIIPLNDNENFSIKALKSSQVQVTTSWYDILRPLYTPEEAKQVQDIVGITSSMVYPIIVKDKPIGILIFSMVKDYSKVTEDEKDLLSVFTDLVGIAVQNSKLFTSLKETKDSMEKMTTKIYQMNAKLHQLDKLKDDFVSVASHELRTPMTAIRSYAWMALNRSDIPLSEKLKKYLSRTMVSTERLINLVNDMLNISRIESGLVEITPKVFDIKDLSHDVADEESIRANEKNVNIVVQEANIPKVFADSDKVHQVLLNLIGNAVKFTPAGGSITVSFFADGQFVEVSIKDTGVGISKDDMSRLFTKFGRLDNSYVAAATNGGTGLGLYICKSLVELMKGKIWASSEGPGKGTTFIFSLPIATETVVSEASKYSNVVPEEKAKYLEPVSI